MVVVVVVRLLFVVKIQNCICFGLPVFSKGLYKALDKVNSFWHLFTCMGGVVASWLVRSSLE